MRIEAFNNGEVGGVHRSRSAGGGKTIKGGFEVVLVSRDLGRQTGIDAGVFAGGKAGRAGGVVQFTDVASTEESDAGSDELVNRWSAAGGSATTAAATGSAVEEEVFKEEQEVPVGDGGGFGRRSWGGGRG